MSKPFDATTRQLIELGPADWLRFLHVPVAHPDRVTVLDSNLSTFTAEADRVIWVAEPLPWIELVELQAGRDLGLPDRVHWYSTILRRTRKVPVRSTVVLLRPAADGPDLTGVYEQRDRQGDVYDWFRYNVVRIWERPVAEVLAAGLPVLPLAPVSDVGANPLPEVLTAVARRFKEEASPEQVKLLWAATKVLMGLRYPEEQIDPIAERISAMILGIRGIEESSVYQGIFAKGLAEGEAKGLAEGEAKGLAEGEAKGLVEGARKTLLRQGRRKLGSPNEDVEARIAALGDFERLQELLDRIMDVATWDELLASLEG
jgi:predicted transposase YdaD